MALISSLVSKLTVKRLQQIDRFRKFPWRTQMEQFYQLIDKAKDTEWGRKYDYKRILGRGEAGVFDFQERIPVHNYETLEPYIDRIRKGARDVLWPGEIKWFAKSSGTTSHKSKFIPVSKESIEDCHFRGGRDVLAIYTAQNPNSTLFKGKGLVIGGSQQVNKYDNDIYYGDLSAVLMENLPLWSQFIRTPDLSIALMDEWEEKIERMAHATIKENVTSISGVPSWTLVLIKRIFELTGKDNLAEIWPNLELFIHGGVSFVPYHDQYKKIIRSPKMHYLETYNASEGFFALQDDTQTNDMLLMLDYGTFYEFIPMEEWGKEKPKALTLDRVEEGKNYAMVISTNGGLWRFLIGDTVRFTSTYPFKLQITGRTKHFINAFGEEVIIDNAEKALRSACEKTGAAVKEYTAAPVFMTDAQKGGHEWLIEFEKLPADLQEFTIQLDESLKQVNTDYEAKRYKNMSLDVPKVYIARNGVFYDWLKRKGKLGGQHKIPRLANHREYIEELLQMNHGNKF